MTRLLAAAVVLLATAPLAAPPRLTLFISVDAFGSDLALRNRHRFKAGLGRLWSEGAAFPAARYEVAECVTGVGHATMVTGAWTARHGVVGNKMLNRATGKLEAIFNDPTHPVLDAPLGSDDASPLNLLAETLADRLRQATQGRGKALAISGKSRSAVAMAGRLGEAWWFHEQMGRFVTGTWYRKEVPTWVRDFNAKKLPDGYHGKTWELLAPEKEYLGADERPFESNWYALGKTFPHPLSGGLPSPGPESYSALAVSPMAHEVQVAFARAAIDGEQLGKDEVPDLLSLSFSAVDRAYHLYGPTSWEVQDHLARLDRALGELLAHAEKAAGGKQHLLVVLTGDHGGANIPEEWAAQGLEAKRVPPAGLQQGLDAALEKRFGIGRLVVAIEEIDVYLDQALLEAKKLDGAAVRRAAAEWLSAQPELQVAVARDDVGRVDPFGLGRVLANSFHPARSGDVLMVMKPFHVLESEKAGTSHGTPWSYDADVPLVLFGHGIKAGPQPMAVSMVDVAPTVAAVLELSAPAMSQGVVLHQALAPAR